MQNAITLLKTSNFSFTIAIAGAPVALHQKNDALRQTMSSDNYEQLKLLHHVANNGQIHSTDINTYSHTSGLIHASVLSPIRGQSCLSMSERNDARITNMMTSAISEHNEHHYDTPIIFGTTPYNAASSLSAVNLNEIMAFLKTQINSTPLGPRTSNSKEQSSENLTTLKHQFQHFLMTDLNLSSSKNVSLKCGSGLSTFLK